MRRRGTRIFYALSIVIGLGACGGPGGAPVGSACSSDSDCASGACGGSVDCPHHCVCTQDSDCPAGEHCQGTTDCGSACAP